MTVVSTYEIVRELGSGGGGVIYLAHHLRLGKDVVLKADKKPFTTDIEQLRREADALKNLSHTYIPQVYDFVSEGGRVYTVMDYIEGESFDKALARGDRFTQPQVIEWARELLDALVYLHSRPPHGILHADIKPANIMLTPQGDIRLIDFNIALALGEEGAVAVGRSQGYASPEHYGAIFSSAGATEPAFTDIISEYPTEIVDGTEIVDVGGKINPPLAVSGFQQHAQANSGVIGQLSGRSYTSGKKAIILDVRSDIYSLGATLYHLLTGRRPAAEAGEVTQLTGSDCSLAVAGFINKAMHPNPNLRYQTTRDMLNAINRLHENDPRARRYRQTCHLWTVSLAVLFMLGVFSSFTGLKRMERTQNAYALAEYSATALREGDVQSALTFALEALPDENSVFIPPHTAQAQKALIDALGVYDLSDGYKPHKSVTLMGEIIALSVSPDGTIAAAMTLGTLTVFDIATGDKLAELPTVDSALADAAFIGNDILVYAGIDGLTAYDVKVRRQLWSGGMATAITISADGTTIAAVYRDDTAAVVYGADGKQLYTVPFGDKHLRIAINDRLANPRDNIFTLNGDGSLLAVSFADGGLRIFDLNDSDNDIEIFDESKNTHFEGGFSGKYFVFSATNNGESLFASIDMETLKQTDAFIAPELITVDARESGVFLAFRDKRVKYDPATLAETDPDFGLALPTYNFQHSIDSPEIIISKLVSHADKEFFGYDSFYDHDEARISNDGKTVMLFSIKGFRLYKITGEVITEVTLADGIYDQQYRRTDGQSYLEVIYYSGDVHKYSASDGSLISEEKLSPPDQSLYEEFFTNTLKITSPLHGTPIAYDLKSGKQIRELETNAYLTYVTQWGDYIITEYISAIDGTRFGLLLNGKTCETLAMLPNLCDVSGDNLIFDIHPGSLRETRIFSINELILKANNYK